MVNKRGDSRAESIILFSVVLSVCLLFFGFEFAPVFVLGVSTFCGYQQYVISRNWREDGKNWAEKIVPGKRHSDNSDYIYCYFLYAGLPISIYCFLVYVVFQIAQGSEQVKDFLFWYFEQNHNFFEFSKKLYSTVDRHYTLIFDDSPLRAQVFAHIYSVVFNAGTLGMFCFLPSLPNFIRRKYYFEVTNYKKSFLIFCFLFFTIMFLMIVYLWLFFLFYAPEMSESRRWGYDILRNDKFIFVILIGQICCAVAVNSTPVSGLGFFLSFVYGKPDGVKKLT